MMDPLAAATAMMALFFVLWLIASKSDSKKPKKSVPESKAATESKAAAESEEALFRDPYAVLADIAASAPAQDAPPRWVVERTLSWFGRNRRLAKDWELASIQIAIRRLS
jgi:hypothetical protein